MKSYLDKDGYERITLVTDKKHPTKRGNVSKHFALHRLLAWEFIGPPPDDDHNVVCHLNDNHYDNRIENLQWGSVADNTNQAKENKRLVVSGVNSPQCLYTNKFIHRICDMLDSKTPKKDIIRILLKESKGKYTEYQLYNVVTKVYSRKYYRDIVGQHSFRPPILYYKPKTKVHKKIRELIMSGASNIDILRSFGEKDYKNHILYNAIMSERMTCTVLFNDYPEREYAQVSGNMVPL